MGYIDVDTHVIECEETWDCLDPSERQYRPVPLEAPGKQLYLIGETFTRRFPTDGRGSGFGAEYTADVTHLENPAVRLREMDALGVDLQVLISTAFIGGNLEHPVAEAAVMRAWNRWVAERTADTGGRLRWVLMAPTRLMDRAFEELEFGKQHGAVGVMLKGIHNGMFLSDPYLFPLYERAQDLDLTIVVHQGAARHHIEGLGIMNPPQSMAHNLHYTATPMQGMYAVIASDMHQRFPRLRWAFVESGASWVPFVFHHFQRFRAALIPDSFIETDAGPSRDIEVLDVHTMMGEKHLYVSVETDEDIPYLNSFVGDGHLMVATDFCHNDIGSDPLAHTVVRNRADVGDALGRALTETTGRRAYGLPVDAAVQPSAARVTVS